MCKTQPVDPAGGGGIPDDVGVPEDDAAAAAEAEAEGDEEEEAGVAGPTNWLIALPASRAETARNFILAVSEEGCCWCRLLFFLVQRSIVGAEGWGNETKLVGFQIGYRSFIPTERATKSLQNREVGEVGCAVQDVCSLARMNEARKR